MAKTILLADDDRMSLELVKRNLLAAGYEVMTAGDGQQALNQLGIKIPDMIILDVEMPNVNGYSFMLERKKLPAAAAVPVVMLTAHEETAPLFKRYGVRGYLIKPLDMKLLLDKVTELIGAPA
jgi:DNA-binding response OmpR family regulator